MKQVDKISMVELKEMAKQMYSQIVKGVVDLEKKIVVIDAEMHADEEAYLLENGSKQKDLWGFNFIPDNFGTDKFVEFDSMINIRPRDNNFSRSVEDPKIQEQILAVVTKVVHE